MGVILWYQVEFTDQQLKLSSDPHSGSCLVDAEISVSYAIGEPGSFQIHFADLPLAVHRTLTDALDTSSGTGHVGVPVVIRLGYLEEPAGHKTAVLAGRVGSIQSSTRFPPLGMLLTGYEEASFRLLTTVAVNGEKPPPALAAISLCDVSPAAAARYVIKSAEVAPAGEMTPDSVEGSSITATAQNAFGLLLRLAHRYGAEVLVQEGQAQFGTKVQYPPGNGPSLSSSPSSLTSLIGREDCLIDLASMSSARLAEFRPVRIGPVAKQRITRDLPQQTDVSAFDFTVLGMPGLRAGQMVAAGVDGYQNPFEGFRILQLTHSFSPRSGYTCGGRAVAVRDSGNRGHSELARQGSPLAIADRITAKIQDSMAISPSVDVGRIRSVKPGDRVASLERGQERADAVVSPSVDVDISGSEPPLPDKPLAAAFAWHNVGLSVPVYEGMRALVNQVRDSHDDAVVTGFVWANDPKMERPEARKGDWWLCLPTELTTGSSPRPTGKGANDLTGADGRRVLETVGLRIAVGRGACSPVGKRPGEGAADVFLITHASGTTIRIGSDGNVAIDSGAHPLVLSAGGVTLTMDKGKVAIT
ncbi:hypothetical protein A6P39_040210 [Streptomyces sp. FXJ1.172]|uniref:hypothetical protein n=1 Tax=Streptomyces sp. FXJ1.172 TaxID=710705 RepID=UPI0007CF4891|nr:hypothetical protein [Streptomyces sp. FXJ1.172]WEO99772.1 hypothetical protein A6P39_040210 [Streptomyces sp. FXJ1.172]